MRHFLSIVFMLAGLTGHCFATEEQPADSGDSTTQAAEPATEGDVGKQQGEKTKGDKKTSGKKKSAGGEEEPDCD